jgi:hypothetical protein
VIEISFDKDLIGPWVFGRIQKTWGPQGREAIGLVQDDVVLAGIVFEDCTGPGGSVSLHVAISHPMVPIRKLLVVAAKYGYDQLGVDKLIGQVPSFNVEALTFDMRLGFQPEAVIKDVFPDGDMVILSMTREQCSFYKPQQSAA